MEPRARAGKNVGKMNFSNQELATLLTACGDVVNPLPETVRVLDEIASDFIQDIALGAARAAHHSGRQKVKLDDFQFAMRRSALFIGKMQETFSRKRNIESARKLLNLDDQLLKEQDKEERKQDKDKKPTTTMAGVAGGGGGRASKSTTAAAAAAAAAASGGSRRGGSAPSAVSAGKRDGDATSAVGAASQASNASNGSRQSGKKRPRDSDGAEGLFGEADDDADADADAGIGPPPPAKKR